MKLKIASLISSRVLSVVSAFTSLILLAAFAFGLASCKVEDNPLQTDNVDGTSEIASQIADVMASVDEMGGASGTLHTMTTCYANGFAACAGNTVVRTYGSCTNNLYTFAGTTNFVWGGGSTSCTMNTVNDYVTRVPNYTIAGARMGDVSYYDDGSSGERLTWVSGAGTKVFNYSSGGVRKVISVAGKVQYDSVSSTASNITVTGQNRSGRVMNGGMLKLISNVDGSLCTIEPQNVTWSDANCTCGASGSWQGTCSGSLIRLDLTDCGHGQMTVGNYSEIVTLDRCQNN